MNDASSLRKEPTLFQASLPLLFLILFLSLNVHLFEDTLGGANQIALILAAAIAGVVAFTTGVRWKEMEASIIRSISSAMPAILILFLIGALAGTWMLSGVVPMLIYYGLEILNPKIFLFAAITISALVSLATGSSWSTIATIGIALMGIGRTLGIHDGLVAGAIISGAYFGDKMSPLSDTTNLAPAMAGTDLFTHIRYMTITTGPSILLAMIAFLVIGFTLHYPVNHADVAEVMTALRETFHLSPVLLVVPVLLIYIIIRKVPAVPALLTGVLLGVIVALIFQPQALDFSLQHLAPRVNPVLHRAGLQLELHAPLGHSRRVHRIHRHRRPGHRHNPGHPGGLHPGPARALRCASPGWLLRSSDR
jgi:NhaC family Na+:H+ antiporter